MLRGRSWRALAFAAAPRPARSPPGHLIDSNHVAAPRRDGRVALLTHRCAWGDAVHRGAPDVLSDPLYDGQGLAAHLAPTVFLEPGGVVPPGLGAVRRQPRKLGLGVEPGA